MDSDMMDIDDPPFYGNAEEKQRLNDRVDRFDASAWVEQRGTWGFGSPCRRPSLLTDTTKLHNPYAGVSYAWQLTETLDSFLTRLPPATTDQSEHVPWIFVCNPYVPRRGKHDAKNECLKGNEDEAPAEDGSQLGLVVRGATERLGLFEDLKQRLDLSGKPAAFINKELLQERNRAVVDILSLAHKGKVRCGKWMLFCPPREVNEVWKVVVKATAQNELGIAAKVAPRPPFDDARRDRLICIYTADFQDRPDVGRVLQRLNQLGLTGPKRGAIFYKPDIFTYIGITHGNPWGLAASIYSSKSFG